MLTLESHKRKLGLYLRALWGTGFGIGHFRPDHENHSQLSYLENDQIYLPDGNLSENDALLFYRAATTHAALHSIYSTNPFQVADLNFLQRSIIGLVEDLRVELMAIDEFPGLRWLWLQFHDVQGPDTKNAQHLMIRLSKSVLDPDYRDEEQWVRKGQELILERFKSHGLDQDAVMEIGLALANDLGQQRIPLNTGRYEQSITYRDDNRCLWQKHIEHQERTSSVNQQAEASPQNNKLIESATGIRLKTSEVESRGSDGLLIRQMDNADFEYKEYLDAPFETSLSYPEWDYRSHVLKQDWCTVKEINALPGSPELIEKILGSHHDTLTRLRYIANKLYIQSQQRVRKLEEGEEVDLDYIVNSMVDLRSGKTPDTRVFMRNDYHKDNSLAISILLDLSESTNETVKETNYQVYKLLRDAVLLLGETLSAAGEHFSISGFSSNGRHNVYYTRYKSFDDDFQANRSRLCGIKGSYSTRLGTAIRHCATELSQQENRKKLLLVITDGAPSDVDVYDTNYLVADSWHAVRSLSQQGIRPFCLNLDSQSESTTEYVFGKGRYQTLDDMRRLPDVLSYLYLKYMRHGA
ncbi:MAG: VWA domain-containing protein [Gammaproteobacteria bacterium]|nr:VWA domain-containing protein [Gammaproteobacteria bacterium]